MKYLNDLFLFLKENHYSPRTIDTYKETLGKAKIYFNKKGIMNDSEITEKHIIDYIKNLEETNAVNSFMSKTVTFLKRYFTFLENSNLIFISPMRNIEDIKEIKKSKPVLTRVEINDILESILPTSDINIRGRMILEVLYSSALRPLELVNLKIRDIDFKNKTLFIKQGKNKKDRVVPVTANAVFWIKKYMDEVRPKYTKVNESNYLLVSFHKGHKHLKSISLYGFITRVLDANNCRHFNPYLMRSTSATHLLNNGMDILYIKELLGHVRISTTQSYLRVRENDLKANIIAKHPRNNFKGESR